MIDKSQMFINLNDDAKDNKLTGSFIVSTPHNMSNDLFKKSLVYIISHGVDGSIGLIVNYPISKLASQAIIKVMQNDKQIDSLDIPIFLGGPVDPERGFIIHSMEYDKNVLFRLNNQLCISSNIDILHDISAGTGPKNSLFVMGYSSWDKGQLEQEMQENAWVVLRSNIDLIFDKNNENKWEEALKQAGINSVQFSSQQGYA